MHEAVGGNHCPSPSHAGWSAHASRPGLSHAHAALMRRSCHENKCFLSTFKKIMEIKPQQTQISFLGNENKVHFFFPDDSCYLERSLGFVWGSFVYNTWLNILM